MQIRPRKLAALLTATALTGAVAVALPATGSAGGPVAGTSGAAKTIKVGDDYFAPADVKIKKGQKVKFKWLETNGNPHNATLTKGPKGVKKKDFKSSTGSIGIKFTPKFKKKGTYDFICTLHASVMQTTVKVKG